MKQWQASLLGVLLLGLLGAHILASNQNSSPDSGFTRGDSSTSMEMFRHLPPMEGADPNRRHQETFSIPTRLLVERLSSGDFAVFDAASARPVVVSLGHKMVVGCKWDLIYYFGSKRNSLAGAFSGVGMLDGGQLANLFGIQGLANRQRTLQLIAELVLFETDVPAQHHWNPEEGRYRELWKGVATGILEGERRVPGK